ncbi:MAG: 1-deoxy-D-xylulose-5-phosphate reductoisomerase [Caldimicrobium sp.]
MINIVILGSTGSIGTSALSLIEALPFKFKILALSAKSRIQKLKEQAERFRVPLLVVENEDAYKWLKENLSYKAEILLGDRGLKEVAEHPQAEIVLIGISGLKALIPTYYALAKGKRVALANKECIIAAGPLLKDIAHKKGGKIIPVDSEHSAFFQLLSCEKRAYVKKLILTASGGPFLNWDKKDFDKITPEIALKHPTWQMGAKITIDSATLMNKGFEVLEAKELFDFPPSNIEVLIHPQSIIHGFVEMIDGSLIAHLSQPDMRIPIAYALSYPERWTLPLTPLNLTMLQGLTFQEVDLEKFPALKLAYQVAEKGPPYPLILEAADEIVVSAFLERSISFSQIPQFLEKTLNEFKFSIIPKDNLEEYLQLYQEVLFFTENLIKKEEKKCF